MISSTCPKAAGSPDKHLEEKQRRVREGKSVSSGHGRAYFKD